MCAHSNVHPDHGLILFVCLPLPQTQLLEPKETKAAQKETKAWVRPKHLQKYSIVPQLNFVFLVIVLLTSLFISLQPQPPPVKQKSSRTTRQEQTTSVKPAASHQSTSRKRSSKRSPELFPGTSHQTPVPRVTAPSHLPSRR